MDMEEAVHVVRIVVDSDPAIPLAALAEGTEDITEDTTGHTEAVVEYRS